MRVYGNIHSAFWTDPKINQLSTEAKLLAVYLLTTGHSTMLGCFRLPYGYVAEDLKWAPDQVVEGFNQLQEIEFLCYDKASGWVFIRHFLKWNPIANPNQGKSIEKLFYQIPTSVEFYKPLVEALLGHRNYLSASFLKGFETVSKPFLNQEQEQYQYQKQDQDQKQKQKQEETLGERMNPLDVDLTENLQALPSRVSPLPFVISLPLLDGSEFEICQTLIDEWQVLYAALDVLQQLKNIRGWNLANPHKRKSRQNISQHINQWLAKANAQSNTQSNTSREGSRCFNLFEHNSQVVKTWLEDSAMGETGRADP